MFFALDLGAGRLRVGLSAGSDGRGRALSVVESAVPPAVGRPLVKHAEPGAADRFVQTGLLKFLQEPFGEVDEVYGGVHATPSQLLRDVG